MDLTGEVMMTTRQPVQSDEMREVKVLPSAALSGASLPTRVLLTPWGPVESTNGSFIVDEESVRLAVAAFDEHGTDLPIDYEHQTLGGTYASPSGKAPAAGWIKRLVAETSVGLFAEIEWTQEATEMLGAREYRYLSPVAIIRKSDRKLVAIHSAALTNKPAIVGMRPIANRQASPLAWESESGEVGLGRLRVELRLPPDAAPEEILVAASRKLEDLGQEAKEREVAERIAEAMVAGKLVEAQRAWAEALVAREEGLFDEWMRTAPVIVRPGRTVPPAGEAGAPQSQHATTAKARAEYRSSSVLSQLTTEEAYVANAAREAARRVCA